MVSAKAFLGHTIVNNREKSYTFIEKDFVK